jgi:hypothetical protein
MGLRLVVQILDVLNDAWPDTIVDVWIRMVVTTRFQIPDTFRSTTTGCFWVISNAVIANGGKGRGVTALLKSIRMDRISIYFVPHG